MTRIKTACWSILLTFVVSVTSAQVKNFSLTVGMNYPVMGSHEQQKKLIGVPVGSASQTTTVSTATVRNWYDSKPGIDLSVRFQFASVRKFFFQSGLSASYIRFQPQSEVTRFPTSSEEFIWTNNGAVQIQDGFGTIYGGIWGRDPDDPVISDSWTLIAPDPNLNSTSILYVQWPVSVGTTMLRERLRVSAGLTVSVLAHSAVLSERATVKDGNLAVETYEDTSGDDFTNTLWRCSVDLTYMVFKQIGINLTYSRSLSRVYKDQDWPHYSNVGLGASWYFRKKVE